VRAGMRALITLAAGGAQAPLRTATPLRTMGGMNEKKSDRALQSLLVAR